MFVLWFMARNGSAFGIDFLHGLPRWVRNVRPDLLDRPSVGTRSNARPRELLDMYLTTSYFELPIGRRHTLDAPGD